MTNNTERYQRQLILDKFGSSAQEKLSKARVLVIGAGGLGCPILQYLAAAGIGTLGIADDDKVTYSNLNRQILYGHADVGRYKVDAAKEKLEALNNEIVLVAYKVRWDQDLSIKYFPNYDIIVDATDNFASRYLINDACVLLKKPLVFGAVSQFEGQVAIFNATKDGSSVNYRDLFPVPPKNNEVKSCSEAGVLGVLPGLIGVMQATEVIKLITDIGEPLINKIGIYNAFEQKIYSLAITKTTAGNNLLPSTIEDFKTTNYEYLCESSTVTEISKEDWMKNKDKYFLVDIREPHELPRLSEYDHLSIPLSELDKRLDELNGHDIVFVCQSGIRSQSAVALIKNSDFKVFSFKGGVIALLNLG